MAVDLDPENWSVADSTELYEVTRWGNGYFSIGENGNLYVHPDRSPKRHVDLKQLIDRLQVRVLTSQSFCGLVKSCRHRLQEIHRLFHFNGRE